ncbi:MAG: hypothetical protein IJC59_07360 [Lachnospiraceae bacterium]|nr:hypothetical protein [Lachnospiraceae bacterium]
MIALQITDVRGFMAGLLNSDCFDSFLLQEASIHTYNTFTIDGHQNRSYYTREELQDPILFPYEYSSWHQMRELVYQLIKGKKTPLFLKIILLLKPEDAYTLLEANHASGYAPNLKSFVVSIRFDQTGLRLTTGTSMLTFLPDKRCDDIWDEAFLDFLNTKKIDYDLLL